MNKQLPSTKLLPCPICGGKAEWGEGEQKIKYGNESVYCSQCYLGSAPQSTKKEAAEWWNARTPDPRLEIALTALRRIRDGVDCNGHADCGCLGCIASEALSQMGEVG